MNGTSRSGAFLSVGSSTSRSQRCFCVSAADALHRCAIIARRFSTLAVASRLAVTVRRDLDSGGGRRRAGDRFRSTIGPRGIYRISPAVFHLWSLSPPRPVPSQNIEQIRRFRSVASCLIKSHRSECARDVNRYPCRDRAKLLQLHRLVRVRRGHTARVALRLLNSRRATNLEDVMVIRIRIVAAAAAILVIASVVPLRAG